MIDTVKYFQRWKLQGSHSRGVLTLDRVSNLRAFFGAQEIEWVEVSLPKLLFSGTNAKLITTQKQIADALQNADAILSKFAAPQQSERHFTRVDLVWHFHKNPQAFFQAHVNCFCHGIRSMSVHKNMHRTTGITWGRERAEMQIRMYDKTDRSFAPYRQIVRVEIQLRGSKLKQALSNGRELTRLDVRQCYDAYRDILLKFQTKTEQVADFNSKDEALFFADSEGVPVFERMAKTLSERQVRTLRKAAGAYALKHFRVNWNNLLPADSLPDYYEPGKLKCPVRIRFRKSG